MKNGEEKENVVLQLNKLIKSIDQSDTGADAVRTCAVCSR